jgi:tetratricopeptide (TPR) repeat protein
MAGVHAGLSKQIVGEAQAAFDNYELAHAEARFDYAFTLDNDNESARLGLALAKSGRGKHFEALDLIGEAKRTADGLAAHAVIALNAGRNGEARDAIDAALILDQDNAAVWSAAAAYQAGEGTHEGWTKSIAFLTMALTCADRNETSARMDRVASYLALNRFDEALNDIHRILFLKPDLAPAHWNRAVALLSLGKWDAGMEEIEWRLKLPWAFSPAFRTLGLPKWKGEPGRVLLVQEGGFGDTIMALRYLPLIENRDLTLLVPKELATLIGYDALTEVPKETGQWDYCLPFMSLIKLCNVIPSKPYLQAGNWRGHVPDHKLRMGIAWSAGRDHSRRKVRSVPLDKLVAAFGGKYELFSMQNHDHGEAEIRGVHISHFQDFADLAGLMQLMDVIVSIDTAAIHLAGALGKPAHLLLDYAPEWRWAGNYNWYPTVTKHVQSSLGDWDSAVAEIAL